jgi:hypothetical protein
MTLVILCVYNIGFNGMSSNFVAPLGVTKFVAIPYMNLVTL